MSNFKYALQRSLKGRTKFISEITKPVLRILVQISVNYIENKNCPTELIEKATAKLVNSGQVTVDVFPEVFTIILQLIQTYLKYPKGSIKEDELKETLKELKFQDECIDSICKVFGSHRDTMALNYYDLKCLKTSPKRLMWWINITLVESGITRLSQPSIIFHIQTSDGEYRTFEASIAMFHRLRYNIATLLKQLQHLETRQIMRK